MKFRLPTFRTPIAEVLKEGRVDTEIDSHVVGTMRRQNNSADGKLLLERMGILIVAALEGLDQAEGADEHHDRNTHGLDADQVLVGRRLDRY
ncbi:MAG: hypothetical protein KW793_02520 [Candidatus Doudnabacteria bacterium]|nr:hypothetical protein [Candidatus Doudnabacteria bacterium]